MKRFASLIAAALLGSLMTLAGYEYFKKDEGQKVQYIAQPSLSKVNYPAGEGAVTVPMDFTAVAEKVTPAVVHIRSTQARSTREQSQQYDPFRDFFGIPRNYGPTQSSGSGVIINESGYIVTNNHVVADADVVDVTLNDNRSFKAEVIGTDPDTDIALLKIKQTGLPFLAFVDSDQSRVGEWVLAVGNPFNLNSTVTAGIISAKGRNINILERNTTEGNTAIESFIQTDAAINPGNSGGALVNMNGGLLGINTAIASPTGAYSGYGFAVPSNIVSKIVEDLMTYGVVQRGWLGIQVTSVNSELVKQYELEVNEGAFVSGFAEDGKSAAKEAGIKEQDVVVKIDNQTIRSSAALIETIGRHRPGDKVMITVNRKGKVVTYPVVLKNREGNLSVVKAEERSGYASLGVEVEDIDAKELKKIELEYGVKVKSLGNGKLAKSTDMREGFIITKVNDVPVKSVKEFNELMKKKKPGELVILTGTYEDFPREFNYAFRM
ncbi:MAG: Do family serine endopeptidase [Cyclobacteriaceae bacterium]|jgi:Do/DeqQ family serine protease|nr:Do family serine endopeptidase [Cyclobacteriaceae bacterium]